VAGRALLCSAMQLYGSGARATDMIQNLPLRASSAQMMSFSWSDELDMRLLV
jgi:hypothetical protein